MSNAGSSINNSEASKTTKLAGSSKHSEEQNTNSRVFISPKSTSQSSIISTATSNKLASSEIVNDSGNSLNVSKISATLSQNGSGSKVVHVQPSNSNSLFIGTLLRQSPKGKDVIPQKVLLTTVKPKDAQPMTRLILPRPSSIHSTTSPPAPATNQICRSFNMIPCSQATLMTSAITLKTADGGSKIIQPNIIRQRTIEGKIITAGSGMTAASIGSSNILSANLIVPGKPPSTLTLIKSQLAKTQSHPDKVFKVVGISKEKSQATSDMNSVSGTDPVKSSESTVGDDAKHPEINNKSRVIDEPVRLNLKTASSSPEVQASEKREADLKSDNHIIDRSKSDNSGTPKSSLEGVSTGQKPMEFLPEEWARSVYCGPLKRPVPPLIPRESITTSVKDIPVKSSLQPSEGRARKRKGSHASSVSLQPKAKSVAECDKYLALLTEAQNMDPFALDWDEHGIGTVPESDIKLVVNEFGLIEHLNATIERENCRNGKVKEVDEFICCLQCKCHSLTSEFINETFCSLKCRDDLYTHLQDVVEIGDEEVLQEDWDKMKLASEHPPNKKMLLSDVTSRKSTDINVLVNEELEKMIEEVSTGSDRESSPPRKICNLDLSKINKKALPKKNKVAVKTNKHPKPTNIQPNQESSEKNKSNIKLRPRTGKKNARYADGIHPDELFMGLSPVAEKVDNRQQASGFRWSHYLSKTNGSPACPKLFTNPFPSKPNRFKAGQKLEAIDPEHQSYFCLVSVAEVKGYRLKLHFDGYPADYDYWVNADSPNIFPVEYCSQHNIPLHLPPGMPVKTFDWSTYLSRYNARAAPSTCFENTKTTSVNLFKVDMKLEAVDRKNTYLVCVATVAAVMDSRILIHFDSWGDLYDYWVDISSPYIRPVGWCEKTGYPLTPPNGLRAENFSWKKYLKETKSVAAPEKAFTLRQPIEFKKDMKIEAVDKRAPHLLRVASIDVCLPYMVKISFDGLPPHFGYWVDDDSPDIHPVGWASRGGHPLEAPPSKEDLLESECQTPGCVGHGYLQSTKYENHTEFAHCPYATEHLSKETTLTNRLKWSSAKYRKYAEDSPVLPIDSDDDSDEDIEGIRWLWIKERQGSTKPSRRVTEEEWNASKVEHDRKSVKRNKDVDKENKSKLLSSNYNINTETSSETNLTEEVKSKDEIKRENTPDTVTDPEEIKKIFGPSSPLSMIDDLTERESSIDIKTDFEDSQKSDSVQSESMKLKVEPTEFSSSQSLDNVKEEIPDDCLKAILKTEEDSLEVKKDDEIQNNMVVSGESTDITDTKNTDSKKDDCVEIESIKLKEEPVEGISSDLTNIQIDVSIEEHKSGVKMDISEQENKTSEKEINELQNSCHINVETEKCDHVVNNIHSEKNDKFDVENKVDSLEKCNDLEEKNALYWNMHQVLQFTKPLLSSCSADCFQGFDGAGFLMLKKSQLMDCMGLCDADADRIFEKIMMLRQKARVCLK